MLSYRHAFHAGNYADVLKHALLTRVLLYMTQKSKPLYYFDTHAGRGLYDLTSFEAGKTGEFHRGIGLLQRQESPPELWPYLDCVESVNQDSNQRVIYPGSPWIAQQFLRSSDRLHLCELHPQDFTPLNGYFSSNRQAKCFREDGFAKALASLPPPEKRGVVMVDPSYEVKSDYSQVVEFLGKAHRKFAMGVFILWYPIADPVRTERMKQQLLDSGIRRISQFELQLTRDHQQFGMTGTGLLVINPPWTLMAEMRTILAHLAQCFKAEGPWLAEELVGE